MNRNNLFWGIMLVLLGMLFLLDNLGFFPGIDVWPLFWALFLMALGGWILISALRKPNFEREHAVVALEGASRAAVRLNHGAGRLELSAADLGANLAEGDFEGGVKVKTVLSGETLEAVLSMPSMDIPFQTAQHGLDWRVQLNRAPDYARLELHTGASESNLDLSELRVSEIIVHAGASSATVRAPAQGQVRLQADTGAATLRIIVPQGVAARIRGRGGLYTLSVDTQRFPRQGEFYLSPDYDTAQNRLEVEVSTGVGTVRVE